MALTAFPLGYSAWNKSTEENDMAATTVIKALTGFFNVGDGKRDSKTWLGELKALDAKTKRELAELVVIETGDALPPLVTATA